MLNRLICLILGYFIGAIIQTGFWIGKFNQIDIRDYGSGNAGTTNTMRTLGKKAGFITYFMDAFKSCITAIIIHFIYGSNSDISEMLLILYGGFGVVLGLTYCTTSKSLALPDIPKAFNDGDTARHIVFSVLWGSATTRLVSSGSKFLSTHSTDA